MVDSDWPSCRSLLAVSSSFWIWSRSWATSSVERALVVGVAGVLAGAGDVGAPGTDGDGDRAGDDDEVDDVDGAGGVDDVDDAGTGATGSEPDATVWWAVVEVDAGSDVEGGAAPHPDNTTAAADTRPATAAATTARLARSVDRCLAALPDRWPATPSVRWTADESGRPDPAHDDEPNAVAPATVAEVRSGLVVAGGGEAGMDKASTDGTRVRWARG